MWTTSAWTFPFDLRIDRQTVMAQFHYFPPELVSRAGALGLGLEISIYPQDLESLAKARVTKKYPSRGRQQTLQTTGANRAPERRGSLVAAGPADLLKDS